MHLVALGINHHSAPIAIREKLAISDYDLPQALKSVSQIPHIEECALLSTCNRTEVYVVCERDSDADEEVLAQALAHFHGLDRHMFDGHFYCYRDSAVVNQLYSVAAGIDSMIIGEPDILRQVKQALERAQSANCIGIYLNKLFQDAIQTGKKARTDTSIARGTFSVGAAAVELAKQIFGETLTGNSVLVLGAGKMSEATVKHLQSHGVPTIMVANRTYEKAVQIASQFGGQACRFDELDDCLLKADIVLCSTAAPHPVVLKPQIIKAMRARQNRPLYLIDIAVPRDVDPAAGDLYNVYLHNIDDLQTLVAHGRDSRTQEVDKARKIVNHSTEEYVRWQHSLAVSPIIIALREKLDSLRQVESERLKTRLPGLTSGEWRMIEAAMQALTNKIAHPATLALKSTVHKNDGDDELKIICNVFGIDANSVDLTSRYSGSGGEEFHDQSPELWMAKEGAV